MAKKSDSKKGTKAEPLTTAATAELADKQIPYALHQYQKSDIDHFYGREIADSLGLDPARVFETLITRIDGRPGSAVVPTSTMIDVPALVAAVGGLQGEVTDQAEAEELSGMKVTAISPFGFAEPLMTIVDVSALDYPTVFVSAGKRGYAIELSPQDLIGVTAARTAPVVRQWQ